MSIKDTIGKNIRRFREDRGLSQEVLGLMAGTHRSYVGGVERGEHCLGVVNLEKLALALEVRVTDIVDDRLDKTPEPDQAVRIHGESFLTMVKQCNNSPDAILNYLERSGVEVIS